jgi:hypothetical protein
MPGKKAHRRRDPGHVGLHGVGDPTAHGRKSAGQTQGQYERDVKRRHGQYGGAGDPPLMKK